MRKSIPSLALIGTGALALVGSAAISTASPAASQAQPRPQGAMTFAALERKALALGIQPTELKIKYRLAEIEGRDRNGRKVEVKLDAQSGAVLQREFDHD